MDIVYLHGLRINTYIGIYEWEQQVRQTLTIDLEMGVDIAAVAAADNISAALDYSAVSERLVAYIEDQHFGLLETLAENIAQLLLAEFKLPWLKLRLGKPGAVPAAGDVGVIVERGAKL